MTKAAESPLGHTPLFTLNDESEGAIRALIGVSTILKACSLADSNSMSLKGAEAAFEMLAGVPDACIETLVRERGFDAI